MSGLKNIDVVNCQAMTWAADLAGLTTGCKLVLLLLARHCDQDARFAASQAVIAEGAGMSVRTVATMLAELVRLGLIERQKGAGGGRGKGRAPDVLTLNLLTAKFTACKIQSANLAVSKKQQTPTAPRVFRGPTSPAPRVRGLDNLSRLVIDSPSEAKASSGIGPLDADADPFTEIEKPKSKPAAKLPVGPALAAYNEAAAASGWIASKTLTDARRGKIAARLREAGMDGWTAQIALAQTMPMLGGDNDRGWRMDLDFFARPSGWAAIAEGKYTRSSRAGGAKATEMGIDHYANAEAARKRWEAARAGQAATTNP